MIRKAATASIAYTASIRNEPTPALIEKASMLLGSLTPDPIAPV
jgi:hypothetical protein